MSNSNASQLPPRQPDSLFIEDPAEIALWERVATSAVVELSPVFAHITDTSAHGAAANTYAVVAAQLADRIVKLRRARVNRVVEPEGARLIQPGR